MVVSGCMRPHNQSNDYVYHIKKFRKLAAALKSVRMCHTLVHYDPPCEIVPCVAHACTTCTRWIRPPLTRPLSHTYAAQSNRSLGVATHRLQTPPPHVAPCPRTTRRPSCQCGRRSGAVAASAEERTRRFRIDNKTIILLNSAESHRGGKLGLLITLVPRA